MTTAIKIENLPVASRVTFLKRRRELFKKAGELSVHCDAEVAVLVFSTTGKLYVSSSSSRYFSTGRRLLFLMLIFGIYAHNICMCVCVSIYEEAWFPVAWCNTYSLIRTRVLVCFPTIAFHGTRGVLLPLFTWKLTYIHAQLCNIHFV
jgi:hypothetical protein